MHDIDFLISLLENHPLQSNLVLWTYFRRTVMYWSRSRNCTKRRPRKQPAPWQAARDEEEEDRGEVEEMDPVGSLQ